MTHLWILMWLFIIAAVCMIGPGMWEAMKLVGTPYIFDLTFKEKHPTIQGINRKKEYLLDCLSGLFIQIKWWIGLVDMADRKKLPYLATFLTFDGTEVPILGYIKRYLMGSMETC